MCVIIVKPAGVPMPSNELINAAFVANPHGCGFVSPSRHYKGLSLDSLKRNLRKVPASEPCIIHFRLATHGSIKRANCHPFRRGDLWLAHNGVLDWPARGDMTDSETALDEILYPAMCEYGYNSESFDDVVHDVIGYSRFAFLKGDELKIYGNFVQADNGCLYSNTIFLRYADMYHPYSKKSKYKIA